MIALLIADEHRLFAQALAAALEAPDVRILRGHPSTGLEAVQAVIDDHPDVALLDYWLHGMTGPAAARVIGRRAPRTKVILTSWFHSAREIHQAAASGAVAFIPKSFEVPQLERAVREAAEKVEDGGPGTPLKEDAADQDWDRLLCLTLREMEILALLSTETAEAIAKELSLSLGTVRNYIQKILTKTATRTQLEAVDLARHHGVI